MFVWLRIEYSCMFQELLLVDIFNVSHFMFKTTKHQTCNCKKMPK
jgi:hypothetical protein